LSLSWERKLRRKEYSKEREQRYLIKRSELEESLEEVFDRQTLLTLYDMLNTGKLKQVMGVVSAGKESRVYHGVGGNGEEFAVKIYLISSAEFRLESLPLVGEGVLTRSKTLRTEQQHLGHGVSRRKRGEVPSSP
jgi:serine/threonine-protein kinase RIO1